MKNWSAQEGWRLYLCVAVLLIAAVAMANSGPIQWADNGLFLVRAAENPLFTLELSEMSHPFFNLVSVGVHRLLGPMALAWLNAALMPVVAALVYVMGRQLGLTRAVALGGVCAALSVHSVIWVATKVEVYTLHLVLVLGCWALYLASPTERMSAWRLSLIGLLTGMAVTTHQLTLVVLAPMMFALLWRERVRMLWVVLGGLIGLFACVPGFMLARGQGESVIGIVRGFLTGGPRPDTISWEGKFLRLDRMWSTPHLMASVLLSLFGVGLLGLLRRPAGGAARLLWVAALMNLVFAISYDVPDRFTFFLPGAVLFALLGAAAVQQGVWGLRPAHILPMVLGALLTYHAVPYLAADWLMRLPRVKTSAPSLNPLTYYFVPLVADRTAERFVTRYEAQVPPGALVYADFQSQEALESAQKMGRFAGRRVLACSHVQPQAGRPAPGYVVQTLGCEQLMPYVSPTPQRIGFLIEPQPPTPARP